MRRADTYRCWWKQELPSAWPRLGRRGRTAERQNGYAERVIRTIKEEEVDLSDYVDYNDAYQQIGRFLDEVYQRKRIHSSLGYLTPAEFEWQWVAVGSQEPARVLG